MSCLLYHGYITCYSDDFFFVGNGTSLNWETGKIPLVSSFDAMYKLAQACLRSPFMKCGCYLLFIVLSFYIVIFFDVDITFIDFI